MAEASKLANNNASLLESGPNDQRIRNNALDEDQWPTLGAQPKIYATPASTDPLTVVKS